MDSSIPKQMDLKETVIQVACGGHHSLVLTLSGKVFAFGSNAYGQIGQTKLKNYASLRVLSCFSKKRVKKIVCGWNHTLVLVEPSFVYSSGLNKYGELGLISFEIRRSFTLIESLIGKNVKDIFAGGYHSWFLLDSNQMVTEYNPPSPLAESVSDSVSENENERRRNMRSTSKNRNERNRQKLSTGIESQRISRGTSLGHSPSDSHKQNKKSFLPTDQPGERTMSMVGANDGLSPNKTPLNPKLNKTTAFIPNLKTLNADFIKGDQNLLKFNLKKKDFMNEEKLKNMYENKNNDRKFDLSENEENLLRNSSKQLKTVFLDSENNFKKVDSKNISPEKREKDKTDFGQTNKREISDEQINEYKLKKNKSENLQIRKSKTSQISDNKHKEPAKNIFESNVKEFDSENESDIINYKIRKTADKNMSKKEASSPAKNYPLQNSTLLSVNFCQKNNQNSLKDSKKEKILNYSGNFETDSTKVKLSKTVPEKSSPNSEMISNKNPTKLGQAKSKSIKFDNYADFYLLFAKLDYCHRFAIIFSQKSKNVALSQKVFECVDKLKKDDCGIAIHSFVTSEEFTLKKTNSFVDKIVESHGTKNTNSHILMMIASCKGYESIKSPIPETDYSKFQNTKSDIGTIFSISEMDVMEDFRLKILGNWYLTLKNSLKGIAESVQFMELRSVSYQ